MAQIHSVHIKVRRLPMCLGWRVVLSVAGEMMILM